MKLSKLTSAVNNFDKANAATSYGEGNPSFMAHIVRLLPIEMQVVLLKQAATLAKEYLQKSTEELKELGVEIDTKPNYRLLRTMLRDDGIH